MRCPCGSDLKGEPGCEGCPGLICTECRTGTRDPSADDGVLFWCPECEGKLRETEAKLEALYRKQWEQERKLHEPECDMGEDCMCGERCRCGRLLDVSSGERCTECIADMADAVYDRWKERGL